MDIPEPADLDWYRLLDVKQAATVDEIKRAFRKLALVHHPDKACGRPDAGSHFRRIREAHDTLCDAHRRYCFDLRYERISAEWDKYEVAQEEYALRAQAERVRKEKLEKKVARERVARERMERERSLLEEVEWIRAKVHSAEKDGRKYQDFESAANQPSSPDEMKETQPPQEDKGRQSNLDFLLWKQYLVEMKSMLQCYEGLYEELRNQHKQAEEEEAQAEAAEKEAEEREAREQKAQEDAARKKEAQEKAAKAEAEREKAKEKAKTEKEAREKAMRERERLAEQRSQEAAKRAREAQEAAAKERLAHQARADKEAREAKAAEEEARRRMTPELEEIFKLFQEYRIRSEKESRRAGTRTKGARDSDCTHRMWWPRSYGTDDCEFCGRLCTRYTLRCPDCDARACVPCKIEQTGA